MDRRSRRPRSLRDLALWSRRSTKPETFARLETCLLGLRSAPECRPRPDLLGYFRLDTGFSVGPNHCCHLLEGLDREDGEHCAIEPFDLPVAAGDDGESFGVGLYPEPTRLGKRAEVLDGALLFG